MSRVPAREPSRSASWGWAGGRVHAAALARIPGVRLAAVAGARPGSERRHASRPRHGARVAAGPGDLIADPDLDAVIVCTPHPLHAQQAIAAAQAGLHVVVEKPMALRPDCTAMIAAAERSGVVLSVISQRRW